MGRITVRVQPRAKKNEVAGERGVAVLLRVTAPPVDGKANGAVRKLIAAELGIAASRVTVVRGIGSRDKTIDVADISAADLRRRLLGAKA